jgi:small subunit ribosomal protein S20
MAHSLSAKKRVRQNQKHRAINRWRKGNVRQLVKEFNELLLHGSAEETQAKLVAIYKTLDQVAAKGTLHKNTASRLKSRLTLALNSKKAAKAA